MVNDRKVITITEGKGLSLFAIERASIVAKIRVDYWNFEEDEKPAAWSIKKIELKRQTPSEVIRVLLDELFRMADEQGMTTIIGYDLVEIYGNAILVCPNGGCFETATYIIKDKEVPAGCYWRNPLREDDANAS